MVHLQREPALGRAAEALGEAQRHLRADAAAPREDAVERRWRNIKAGCQLTAGDAVRLEVNGIDELPGMRWIVHGHQ
jgi:hypothetical protein